jgi:2-succinyl-5-enolpyruvyl-6-hydroxy-3-cyclohexene-1-carboxylate synthase
MVEESNPPNNREKQMITSTKLAHSIIRELIECGVNQFVLSPGSRNAPLAIALYEAATKNLIDLHVKIDERGAAFFALGIAKVANNYVAVICTSGTAAANFAPAAHEAFHSQSKLIIITADRPARLRKTGANQTTDQVGIYQSIPTHDFATSIAIRPLLTNGPIHLNPQFDEPLVCVESENWLDGLKVNPINNKVESSSKLNLTDGVLVIGHDRGGFSVAEVMGFARKLDWPIITEDPISFPNAIAHASLFLTDEAIRNKLAPETVIVIGRTTLSRSTNSFISTAKKVIVIDPRSTSVDTSRTADQILTALPIDVVSSSGQNTIWESASIAAASELEGIPWSEQRVIIELIDLIPDESAIYIGSSRPVRDIEAFTHPRSGVSVFANRGLAGIDGNISTVFGVAEKFETTFAILGDLTYLHDISALINKSTQNIRLFVIDNNGGGIFSTLSQANVDGFEQLFGTPHNLDLVKVTQGFGVESSLVTNLVELHAAIRRPINGLDVVIIKTPNRAQNAELLKELTHKVSKAVRIGINLA